MRKRESGLSMALTAMALMVGAAAHAEGGFPVHNEGALARTTALPNLGEAAVLAPGTQAFGFTVDWTNEFVAETKGSEALVIDGETQRLAASLRYGVTKDLELGLSIPLLITGSGVLDPVIENWHNLFGLPNGGRNDAPRNRLLYEVQRNGQTLLDVPHATTGLGDIEVSGGWQLAQPLALRAMVKLPTGDEDKLTGGNLGSALWLDWNPFDTFGGSRRWFGFVSGGASLNAKSSVLSSYQEQFVGFGGLGAGYRLLRPLSAIVQFYAHTPLYSGTALDALQKPGGQLTVGGRWTFDPHTSVDLAFQEDLVTNSSPDISFHLGLSLH